MVSLTPNYNWNLPAVNDPTDEDQWGGLLNENISDQDTVVKDISDTANTDATIKSANYAVVSTDRGDTILVDATAAARIITLPAGTIGAGFKVTIKKTDSSVNTVTVSGTIDGASSYVLEDQYEFVQVVSDGANWSLIGENKEIIEVIVNTAYAETAAYSSVAATIPLDDTIPQITEGAQILTVSITPKSATNKLRISVKIEGTPSNTNIYTAALFKVGTNDAIAATMIANSSTNSPIPLSIQKEIVAGATTAQTFTVRMGNLNGNAFYLNGNAGARLLGGALVTSIAIEEITA